MLGRGKTWEAGPTEGSVSMGLAWSFGRLPPWSPELPGLPGSLLQHLLSGCCVPGLGLGTGETAPSKAATVPALHGRSTLPEQRPHAGECMITRMARRMEKITRCMRDSHLGTLVEVGEPEKASLEVLTFERSPEKGGKLGSRQRELGLQGVRAAPSPEGGAEDGGLAESLAVVWTGGGTGLVIMVEAGLGMRKGTHCWKEITPFSGPEFDSGA